jgi:hypothetical protein
MPEVTLRFVNVISPFATPSGVLRVQGVYSVSSWSHAKYKRVLQRVGWKLSFYCCAQTRKTTDLCSNRRFIFSVPLNGEVQHRLLVLVLQKSVYHKGMFGVTRFYQGPRDILDPDLYPSPNLRVTQGD